MFRRRPEARSRWRSRPRTAPPGHEARERFYLSRAARLKFRATPSEQVVDFVGVQNLRALEGEPEHLRNRVHQMDRHDLPDGERNVLEEILLVSSGQDDRPHTD